MTASGLHLAVLPGTYAVCRLPPGVAVPPEIWGADGLVSVTATRLETSVVCPDDAQGRVPPSARLEAGWAALEVAGPLDFGLTGVLASLTAALATAGVPVFALSTYDTDYLLVRASQLDAAVDALRTAGHEVSVAPVP